MFRKQTKSILFLLYNYLVTLGSKMQYNIILLSNLLYNMFKSPKSF